MKNEEQFKKIVAKNLANYRKVNNYTQLELAEKLFYSDKAISKWERGESLPDLYTMNVIADFYGVTINDLCQEKEPILVKKESRRSLHMFVTLLSFLLVWFVAAVIFAFLTIFAKGPFWLSFIYAILASSIVLTVFTCIWYNNFCRCLSVSGIIWGAAMSIHLTFIQFPVDASASWLIYVVAALLEVLFIIWFFMVHTLKKNKNKQYQKKSKKDKKKDEIKEEIQEEKPEQ